MSLLHRGSQLSCLLDDNDTSKTLDTEPRDDRQIIVNWLQRIVIDRSPVSLRTDLERLGQSDLGLAVHADHDDASFPFLNFRSVALTPLLQRDSHLLCVGVNVNARARSDCRRTLSIALRTLSLRELFRYRIAPLPAGTYL